MNDWVILNANFYTNGGVNFGLLYNPKTGDFQIKQRDIFGGFSLPGLAVLYENGNWKGDALRINDLFTYNPGDLLQANPIQTSTAINLNTLARRQVYAAYQTQGGKNSGLVLNSTALPQNQNGAAGTTNAAAGTSAGIAGAIPILSNPPGQGNILDLFSPGLTSTVNFPTIPNPALTGEVLTYPIDLIQNSQDTLHITQVEYQSPTQELFSGTADIDKIIQDGITRNTVVKTKLQGSVILPIPNNAQDSNNVAWNTDEMNSLTAGATATVSNNLAGTSAGLAASEILKAMPGFGGVAGQIPRIALLASLYNRALGSNQSESLVKSALASYVLQKYGIEVPPESILARGGGIVPNSNLQLLFNNVTLRNFNFSYMMSPRSENEATRINKILRFFKQGMAAKKNSVQAGGASLFLGTPNVFKLEYRSGNSSIKGMNKFKICALKGFNVNYSPNNQWSAFEGGQPSSVIMTMSFQEIEPIYNTDYQDNKSGDIVFDNPQVKADEIGF
jgi:hypothetical protein